MSRIISGRARGTKLAVPAGDATRPTTDRVREAVFSALVSWLGTSDAGVDEQFADITFLDLFAGSGAMGLEAASRGAAQVHLVEAAHGAIGCIRENAQRSHLSITSHQAKVDTFLTTQSPTPFDIVWADPPYAHSTEAMNHTMHLVADHGWLAHNGLLVVERSSRDEPLTFPASLDDRWERRYGETTIYYAQSSQEHHD